ncbi:MAG: hypothetical protein R2738_10205 [Bacteroides graminisolvens]
MAETIGCLILPLCDAKYGKYGTMDKRISSREVIEGDIVAGNSYVCMDDEEMVATFVSGKVRMIRMITLKMVNG